MGNAVRKRVDVAVVAIGERHLLGEPVGRNGAFALEMRVERNHEFGVRRRRDFSVIGNLADFPQAFDVGLRAGDGADFVVARRVIEDEHIFGDGRAR